jgi:hypothetical protein
MRVTTMERTANDNGPFQAMHEHHVVRPRGAAINEAVLADLAHNFSDTTLLNRDYKRCAETMISNFGSRALLRAERRALEMLGDGNHDGSDIWTRVAATIRWIR